MTKVYPRLERRKLARMNAGKRPYKTLQEKQVYTQIISNAINPGEHTDYYASDSCYSPRRRTYVVRNEAGTVCLHTTYNSYDEECKLSGTCSELTSKLVAHVVACIKDNNLTKYYSQIQDAFMGESTFVYPAFDTCVERCREEQKKKAAANKADQFYFGPRLNAILNRI